MVMIVLNKTRSLKFSDNYTHRLLYSDQPGMGVREFKVRNISSRHIFLYFLTFFLFANVFLNSKRR